jgi:hypothetical protein
MSGYYVNMSYNFSSNGAGVPGVHFHLRNPWHPAESATAEKLLSPVTIAGTVTVLEMMKSIPVSNNNLPIVHLRDQLRG